MADELRAVSVIDTKIQERSLHLYLKTWFIDKMRSVPVNLLVEKILMAGVTGSTSSKCLKPKGLLPVTCRFFTADYESMPIRALEEAM